MIYQVSAGVRREIGSSSLGTGTIVSSHRSVVIGDGCQIAGYVSMRVQIHVHDARTPLTSWRCTADAVVTADDVWVGSKVTILAGLRFGHHATCGAGAVVTHDVAAGVTVGGVPARSISVEKSLDDLTGPGS